MRLLVVFGALLVALPLLIAVDGAGHGSPEPRRCPPLAGREDHHPRSLQDRSGSAAGATLDFFFLRRSSSGSLRWPCGLCCCSSPPEWLHWRNRPAWAQPGRRALCPGNDCGGHCTCRVLHLDAAPALPGLPRLRGGADWRHSALKRSISLSRGTKGRIFLLYLLGTVLNYLLTMAFTIPAIIVIALVPGASNPKYAQTAGMVMMLIIYGAAFAIQALTKPVYGIALMLFYYDQRIRQEGFDIELLMQRAGLVTPPPPPPPAETWPPSILPRAQAAAAVMPKSAMLQQPAEPIQTKSEESL